MIAPSSARFALSVLLGIFGCGGSTTGDGLLNPSTGGTGGSVGAAGTAAGAAGTSAGEGGAAGAGASSGTGAAAGAGAGAPGAGAAGGSGGSPAGGGGTGAGGGGNGAGAGAAGAAGGGGKVCEECLAASCATREVDCANDPTCASCVQPGQTASLSCFSNASLNALLGCSCQACELECPTVQCKALPCLACSATSCKKQIAACDADATCPKCLQKDPPPECKTNPAAIALYQCDTKKCAGPCGL